MGLAVSVKKAEEEQLVADDWAAESAAVLILLVRSLGRCEVVRGGDILIPEELIGAAMEVVGSTLGGQVDCRAGGPAELRLIGVGLFLKLLNRIDRRTHRESTEERVGSVKAIDVEQIAAPCLPIDCGGDIRPPPSEIGDRALRNADRHRSRCELQQLYELPAVQRELINFLRGDDTSQSGGFRLQHGDRLGHRNRLFHGTHSQGKVETRQLVNLQFDIWLRRVLEARLRNGYGVYAWLQQRHGEEARLVGLCGARNSSRSLYHGHGCIRYDSAGSILDKTRQGGRIDLTECVRGMECEQHRQYRNRPESRNADSPGRGFGKCLLG